jgi:hypothetical protein
VTPEPATKTRHAISRLADPFFAALDAMEPLIREGRPLRLALAGVSVIFAWYIYVPIHELLHALGCAASGGTVTTLEVQTQYGGAILARLFPFVEAGGDYAGRLSDFDTHGSDLVYLATDALPYLLSIVIGVPLLRSCARRSRPLWFGPAFVLGLAPFYNLPGDYFEMGSIIVTRGLGPDWHELRSDDLFRLIDGLVSARPDAGLAAPLLAVAASFVVAIALAYASWWLGDLLARVFLRPQTSR